MTYLLCGIVKDPAVITSNLTGVRGKPVIFVEGHGLCAAVSETDVEEGAPPVAELLDYSRVVEALHSCQAVIPIRYGCFLNGIPAIQAVLKERRRQYERLLAELTGHVEMSVHILMSENGRTLRQGETSLCSEALPPPESEKEPPASQGFQPANGGNKGLAEQVARQGNTRSGKEDNHSSPEGTTLPNEKSTIGGRAYLALRKVHYQMQDETLQGHQALIDRYIQAFSGLYTKRRTETDEKKGAVILSIYFLTPENAISRFQETFGNMMKNGNDEAILSGPWPPYNFVTPEIGKYG